MVKSIATLDSIITNELIMLLKKLKLSDFHNDLVSFLNTKKDFFNSYSWYKNMVSNVFDYDSIEHFFFVISENNKILTIFPFIHYRKYNVFKCLKSLSNYYSPIYNIFDSKLSDNAVDIVFDDLKKKPFVWDTIEIRPVSDTDCKRLALLFNKSGIPCMPFFCFVNWFHIVNGQSYSEYFQSRSSKVKNTVKRKLKKFQALQYSKIIVLTDSVNIEKGINDYQQVYKNSWKQAEPYPMFISGLISYAAKESSLRLGIAYINDRPVAAQIWFVADQSAYIYKLAYDENYKQYSAGTLLTARLMAYVIDVDNVKTIDYLSGNDNYKKDWMTQHRMRWGVMAFNTGTVLGCASYTIERIKFSLKGVVCKLKEVCPIS